MSSLSQGTLITLILLLGQVRPFVLRENVLPHGQDSPLGNFSSAAIAVDGRPCAKIGMDIIRFSGNAIDAAIAGLFCNGIFNAQSMGIGGGFFMTIFDSISGEVVALNARETAPLYTYPDMFDGNASAPQSSPLGVAIPGQVKGLYEAKERYGNPSVSWSSLIQPSIDMCRNGIEVGFSLANSLFRHQDEIKRDPGLSSVFVNPDTEEVWNEGDYFTWESLAQTLERLAEYGADDFYNGVIGVGLIEDIRQWGGNLSMEDLASYSVRWEDPLSVDLGQGKTLYSLNPPSSGAILAYILNILKYYEFEPIQDEPELLFHRVTESFKWAYAARTRLGDPFDDEFSDFVNSVVANITSDSWAFDSFMKINDTFTVNNASYYGADFATPEDHGTAHLSVIGPDGSAVSVTSTINLEFGVKYMSPSTGIILNNEMDDFSYPNITNYFGVPPSPSNFAKPGKQPQSSMCPALVVDKNTNEVVMAVGAAGGTRITTSTAWVILRHLFLGQNIKDAIAKQRIHHQLAPMLAYYEEERADQSILDFLTSVGHELEADYLNSVVEGVTKGEGRVYANSDDRKDGGIDGF